VVTSVTGPLVSRVAPYKEPNRENLFCVPHLRMNTDPVSKMLCFLVFRISDDGQSPKTC
jgi:hypothetical protein